LDADSNVTGVRIWSPRAIAQEEQTEIAQSEGNGRELGSPP